MAEVTIGPRESRPSLWMKLAYAAAGFVLGAAATGGVMYLAFTGPAGGDEPPIWVKGGSISIELLKNTTKWEKESNTSKRWRPKGGVHASLNYQLVIGTSQPGGCTSLIPSGPLVEVEYSDGTWIKFTVANGKTHVEPTYSDANKVLQPDGDTKLTYDAGGQGFIKTIKVGSDSCSFSQADPKLVFVLLDKQL